MERIEEFEQDGKRFVFIDLSGIKANEVFAQIVESSKSVIRAYGEGGVYTITDITNVMFDTKTKKMAAEWTAYNKPYVKYGVIVGMDNIRRIMVSAVFALSGRKNMGFASTREEAVAWLLQQE